MAGNTTYMFIYTYVRHIQKQQHQQQTTTTTTRKGNHLAKLIIIKL